MLHLVKTRQVARTMLHLGTTRFATLRLDSQCFVVGQVANGDVT